MMGSNNSQMPSSTNHFLSRLLLCHTHLQSLIRPSDRLLPCFDFSSAETFCVCLWLIAVSFTFLFFSFSLRSLSFVAVCSLSRLVSPPRETPPCHQRTDLISCPLLLLSLSLSLSALPPFLLLASALAVLLRCCQMRQRLPVRTSETVSDRCNSGPTTPV